MPYEPLHQKYRPQTFADLVGQSAIADTLTNAIKRQRIAAAYLFSGPRGTGKTSSARILAKSLNCLNSSEPTAEPCGVCESCRAISQSNALDIIEIDAASNTGVDNIRELIERSSFAPVQSRYKLYIIDECLTGDSLIHTSQGLMRVDDPNIQGKMVLSYNESQQKWEYQRVLRWLNQGIKPTLLIQTSHRQIRCTENHLIRTEQGWIQAKNLKEGMKILSPASVDAEYSSTNTEQMEEFGDLQEDINLDAINTEKNHITSQQFWNKQNSYALFALVDVIKNYLSLNSYKRRAKEFKVSNLIGKDIPMQRVMAFGINVLRNLWLQLKPCRKNSWGLSTERCWETGVLTTPINIVDFQDYIGSTDLDKGNGYNTKLCDYPSYSPIYKKPIIEDMVNELWFAVQFFIPNYKRFMKWYIRMKSLLSGLTISDIQLRLNSILEKKQIRNTNTFQWEQNQLESGYQTLNTFQFHQWNTNLETVESVHPVGVESVYDLEVETNHNFVANGLLVHNCHMLSTAAFNALLKTLEEPPPRVVFVLATTDPQRVLPTIISRCQRFDFRRIPLTAMVSHLNHIAQQEGIDITPEALSVIAQVSHGGLRDAQSLLDQLSLLSEQITIERVWDLVGAIPEQDLITLLKAIKQQNGEQVITLCRQLMDRGREPIIVLQNLAGFYRDLLLAKTVPQQSELVALTASTWKQLCDEAQQWTTSEILAGQKHLQDSEAQVKHTTQPRLWLEVTLLGLINTTGNQPQVTEEKASLPIPETPVASKPETSTNPPPETPVSQPSPVASKPETPATPPSERKKVEPEASSTQLETEGREETPNLEKVWEQVIGNLPLPAQSLVKDHCRLLSLDGNLARVGVKTQPLFQFAKKREKNIEQALRKVLNQEIKLTLEVSQVNQVNTANSVSPAESKTDIPENKTPSVHSPNPSPPETDQSPEEKPSQGSENHFPKPEDDNGHNGSSQPVNFKENEAIASTEITEETPSEVTTFEDEDVTKIAQELAKAFNGEVISTDEES